MAGLPGSVTDEHPRRIQPSSARVKEGELDVSGLFEVFIASEIANVNTAKKRARVGATKKDKLF